MLLQLWHKAAPSQQLQIKSVLPALDAKEKAKLRPPNMEWEMLLPQNGNRRAQSQ